MNDVPEKSVSVIVAAAGVGTRMRADVRKPWLTVAGEPIVVHVLKRFVGLDITREVILVVHPEDVARAEALRERFDGLLVTVGGEHRVASVRAGLACVSAEARLIAVQDGVRPLADEDVIRRTCEAALEKGAAIPVVPVRGTLKEIPVEPSASGPALIARTATREGLYEAQTPQVFHAEVLRKAYAQLDDMSVTDDAQVVERSGGVVAAVPGSVRNIKITTPEDLRLAEVLLHE
ncbi:MAG TPA: 2-C-methyl-D-erythritol 4-phosphate cytidylyltransferase [Planctomycetota bacterium]|nr:2-C-methyl-D-erythritol 4-phosphate cytidylyltransferase [Planctomycetota bacterium]